MTNQLLFSKLRISTCVYKAKIDINNGKDIDIYSLFNFLPLDSQILGLKYNNNIKGDMKKTTGSIYNQLSIKIFITHLNKETNLKLFVNGSIQLSGVKNDDHAYNTVKIFLQKIVNFNGFYYKNVILENNIIYDAQDYENLQNKKFSRFNFIKIYKKNKLKNGIEYYSCIGEKRKNKFLINKKELIFDEDNNFFIEKRHTDFIKKIYDTSGNYIGYYKFEMKFNKKNLVLHKCSFKQIDTNIWVIYKYNTEIGKKYLFIEKPPIIYKKLNEICINYNIVNNLDLKQKILSGKLFKNNDIFKNEINMEIGNINTTFKINLSDINMCIDISSFHNIISMKYNIISNYQSENKYQAINIKLFYNEDFVMVNCNDKYIYKITTAIFCNGTINIYGCTNKKQILTIKKFFIDLFNNNYNEILIPKINKINKNTKNIVDSNQISIWDIL